MPGPHRESSPYKRTCKKERADACPHKPLVLSSRWLKAAGHRQTVYRAYPGGSSTRGPLGNWVFGPRRAIFARKSDGIRSPIHEATTSPKATIGQIAAKTSAKTSPPYPLGSPMAWLAYHRQSRGKHGIVAPCKLYDFTKSTFLPTEHFTAIPLQSTSMPTALRRS